MPDRPRNVLPTTVSHNPGRYADREGVEVELLDAGSAPPEFFNEAERKVWVRVHQDSPKGLIARMHMGALIVLCQLEAKMVRRELNSKDLALLITLYAKFGMTPADQARVYIPPSKQMNLDDEWAQFVQ